MTELFDDTSFVLTRCGEPPDRDRKFSITEKQSVEVADDVFVAAGDLYQQGIIRAVIDAPRNVLILRGDKYREGVRHVS